MLRWLLLLAVVFRWNFVAAASDLETTCPAAPSPWIQVPFTDKVPRPCYYHNRLTGQDQDALFDNADPCLPSN